MAALATFGRVSARKLSSQTIQQGARTRAFCNSVQRYAASNFVMPAMSPTMTEGNITSWKVKEGDSFSAGDVLLEIETDKAQMDVEAQEDGILAKITQQGGAKSVKVGSRIAVLAEEGDDLSTLDIPAAEESQSVSSAQKSKGESSSSTSKVEDTNTSKKEESLPKEASSQSSSSTSQQSHGSHTERKYSYPLYPAVEQLLHTNNVSESQLKDIVPTGPSGRILKGDVLAYLSKISKSYPSEQAARISKLAHLDLQNIKIASPKPEERAEAKEPAALVEELIPDLQVLLPISLSAVYATQKKIKESLGVSLPLSVFIARASEIANDDLPIAKGVAPTANELFDAVLGLGPLKRTSKGRYTPVVTALPSPATRINPEKVTRSKEVDIIDILTGTSKRLSSRPSVIPNAGLIADGPSGLNSGPIFSLSVPKEEKMRARVYLERIKTVLEVEPGRCVL